MHDHADSHCLMKILRGELRETRWVTPMEEEGGKRKEGEMEVEGVRTYREEKVAYMCDSVCLVLSSFAYPHIHHIHHIHHTHHPSLAILHTILPLQPLVLHINCY